MLVNWRPSAFQAPTRASAVPALSKGEPLDVLVRGSVDSMMAALGPELAERASRTWGKGLEKAAAGPATMVAVWLASNWLADLKPEQLSGQDHTPYVLPFLRASNHPAAPAILEVVDHFLPQLPSPRDRNHLVESAARALRRETVGQARLAFGQFCGALGDGGLAVRRHLAEQVRASDPEQAELMTFGLKLAERLDDRTPLGQHQASRSLYACFMTSQFADSDPEQRCVAAAAVLSYPGNTLWSENAFASRFPDTVALIQDPGRLEEVARTCLETLGQQYGLPKVLEQGEPVATLQQIGALWPQLRQLYPAPAAGVQLEADRVVVGGSWLPVRSAVQPFFQA
ncbi:hypothetical protein DYH09_02575 [bacterium CPR1]|nr:hypothetical protein [bacterium CPR1]